MTISLEEHVARAIEAEKKRVMATLETVVKQRDAALEALADKERARAMWQDDSAGWQDEAGTARESERAACEAIAQSVVDAGGNARGIVASISARKGKGEWK